MCETWKAVILKDTQGNIEKINHTQVCNELQKQNKAIHFRTANVKITLWNGDNGPLCRTLMQLYLEYCFQSLLIPITHSHKELTSCSVALEAGPYLSITANRTFFCLPFLFLICALFPFRATAFLCLRWIPEKEETWLQKYFSCSAPVQPHVEAPLCFFHLSAPGIQG